MAHHDVLHRRRILVASGKKQTEFMGTRPKCNKEKHNKTLSEHWEWRVERGLDPENLGRKHGLLGESNN